MKKQEVRSWRLEYQWDSPKSFDKHCVKSRNLPYTNKWFNGKGRYRTLEKAHQGLRRRFQDPYFVALVIGRNWRLRNIETGEQREVIIKKNQIIIL